MTRFTNLVALCVALVGGAGISGCKAETLEEFEGEPETKTIAWQSGGNLQVEGLNGEIRLEQGPADEIRVEFKPFVFQGYTKDEAEAQRAMDMLRFSLTESNGTIFAETTVDGDIDEASVGAHMIVYVPSQFNSGIHIENENGEVEVDYVGSATSLIVDNEGAGDCLIQGSPTVRSTNVRCGFKTRVTDVSDAVTVQNTGLDDVDVRIASVSDGSAGGHVRSESGAVNLIMPLSGNYSVQATSQSGTVNTGSLPTGCTVQVAAENSKTVTCGSGGPNYLADADDDVNLAYQ